MEKVRQLKQNLKILIEYENGKKEIHYSGNVCKIKLDKYNRLFKKYKNHNYLSIHPPLNCNLNDFDILSGKDKNWPDNVNWNYKKNSWLKFGKKNISEPDIKSDIEKFKTKYYYANELLNNNETLQTIDNFIKLHLLVDDINEKIFIYGGKFWYSMLVKKFNRFVEV